MKELSRETLAVTNHKGQKMIITLEPGDVLTFRAKGKRTSYSVPIQACYNLALIHTVNSWHKKKMEEWHEKKKAGIRTRRPRKLTSVFSKSYYEALRINT